MNVKTTVAASRMGWLWWIIDPLVMMAIYYFVIGVIFQRGGENYHLFVLTGVVAWQFFSRSLNNAARSVSQNKALICQIGIPMPILVAIPPIVQSFFAFIGVMIVMIWSHEHVGMQTLAVFPLLLLIALMAYGLGLFLAVFEVYVKDVGKLLGYILRAGFFLSPVLYSASRILDSDRVPHFAKVLFQLNPMAWILTALRKILLEGVMFDVVAFGLIALISIVMIQLGLVYIRSSANAITKLL